MTVMTLRFYSALPSSITTLSFDLDDTLYYNEEVIQLAEQAQFDAVCQHVPEAKLEGIQYWIDLKWQVLKQNPDLCHDVTQWRTMVISTGLENFGVKGDKNRVLTQKVFDVFYLARSNFKVPQQTFDVLTQLKQKFRLIAVTNGNADFERIGLAPYFEGYYRAGERGTRMKPFADLLELATNDFNIELSSILHIGDNVSTDVKAAQNAACPSLWFNPEQKHYPAGFALPTAEYHDLADLLALL